jgi:hypothetical protein
MTQHGTRWREVVAWFAALGLATVLPATTNAQRVADARTHSYGSATTPARVPAADGPEIPDFEAEPILVVNGAPRSFQVVRVPVPAEFAADQGVSFDIVTTAGAPLLGRRSGGLAGGRGRERVVVITVGIPAVAVAGRTTIAYVRFFANGARGVRVPVDLAVPAIPRVRITPAQNLRGARPGEQFELWFEVANAGNLRDSLDLRIDAPPTWNVRFTAPSRVVMQPGETINRSVRMLVPPASDIGDFPITLIALAGLTERGRATTIVQVTDVMRTAQRGGPVVVVGAASAMSQGSSTRPVESVTIDGPVSDGVTVSGRLSTPMPADPVVNRALSTMGYSAQSNFMSVSARHWGAAVGTTGLSLGELAGQSVFGRGASIQLRSDQLQLRVLGAAPLAAEGTTWTAPTLYAAAADVRVGPGLITGFFASLRDSTYAVRSLDVAGIGGEVSPWSHSLISAQVAERQYRDGSGVGAAGDVRGPIAGADVDLRIVHAPGGTAAFASTRDALSAAAGRTFGHLRTDVRYWGTQDRNSAATDIASTGWSVSPSYALFAPLTLGVDVRHSGFTSSDDRGAFGSNQQEYGGRARLVYRGFDLSADSRWSTVASDVTAATGAHFVDQTQRVTSRARLDHMGTYGDIGVGGSIETATAGPSSIPAPTSADVHVERLQLVPWVPGLTLSAAMQRMQYGAAVLTTSRGELALEMHRSIRVILGAEKGTVRDAAGIVRTVMTLRVERTTLLPSFDRHVITGVVFQDRNGNGLRDGGEPGIGGIVVHRGAESAVSDSKGVFRISRDASGRTEIDSRSLPEGWLQSPRLLDGVANDLELGVVPTTSLEIRVALAPLADGSVPNARLGTATLVLHDSTGREWTARTDALARAMFDALPAGRYTLDVDLGNASEPLLIDSIPAITIGSTPGRQHVVVLARTRPVRIFRPRTPAAETTPASPSAPAPSPVADRTRP